jgi:hypothetical protein
LTICVPAAGCDTDTHSLAGDFLIEIEEWWPPEQAALRNFRLRAQTNFDFSFFSGGLVGTVTNLEINLADPAALRPCGPSSRSTAI